MPPQEHRARIITPIEDEQEEVIQEEEEVIKIKQINPQEVEHMTHISAKLNGHNWFTWKGEIQDCFKLAKLGDMVFRGTIKEPDPKTEPLNYSAWEFNNCYAQVLLRKNMEESQMQYIQDNANAHDMWIALCQIYDAKSFNTVLTTACTLFETRASEKDDIEKHIKTLQRCWQQTHLYDHKMLTINEDLFMGLLLKSLPPSWKDFIHPFLGKWFAAPGQPLEAYDKRSDLTKYDLIGTLIEEARRRKAEAASATKRTTLLVENTSSNQPTLQSRIGNQSTGQ
jgi:gag-polypeptide of LTR copia-type